MREDLHSFMRVGIVQFMAFPETMGGSGPVVESIGAICRDEFFESIEITQVNDPEDRKAVSHMLATSNMEVGFGAQPIQLGNKLDLNSADPAARAHAVEKLQQAARDAADLGAGKFALMSGPDPGADRREEAIDLLVDSLSQICATARSVGVPVALEVFDREVDKKSLIGSTHDAVRVAARLRPEFPDFGLMLDLSHLPLQGESSREALTLAKDYLTHIHIGNCVLDPDHPGYGDTHPPFGVPEGVNDVRELAEFLRVLLDIGYLDSGIPRTVAFEVRPRSGDDSNVVIANAKRTLRAAWREL